VGACTLSLGTGVDPAWACEPPANAPTLITFEGIAIGVEEDDSEFGPGIAEWTFQVEPPVEGLSETVTVAIQRSDAGDGAACEIAGPDLVVGNSYRVTAGQSPGQRVLNVSLYVGTYSKIATPPGAEVTVTSPETIVESAVSATRKQSVARPPTWIWPLLGTAIVVTVLTTKRRSGRTPPSESSATD
jgi:hypothetical protein